MACDHGCGFFNPEVAGQLMSRMDEFREDMKEIRKDMSGMRTDIASVSTHVKIYLGNGTPGQVPKSLEALTEKVGKHETFISRAQGALKLCAWGTGSGSIIALLMWLAKVIR